MGPWGLNIFAVHLFKNCSYHLTGHISECLCLASFLKGLNNRSLDGHNVGAYMPFRPSVGNRDMRRHQMVYLIVRTLTHIKYLFSILLFFGQNAVYPGADITFLLIFLPEFSLGILFWLCSLVWRGCSTILFLCFYMGGTPLEPLRMDFCLYKTIGFKRCLRLWL